MPTFNQPDHERRPMFQTLDNGLIGFADRAMGAAQARLGRTLPEILAFISAPVAAGWVLVPIALALDSEPPVALASLPLAAAALFLLGRPARRFALDAGKTWNASLSQSYFGFSEEQRLGGGSARLAFLFIALFVLAVAVFWTLSERDVLVSDIVSLAVHVASPVVLYCYCARPRPPSIGQCHPAAQTTPDPA